MKGNGLKETPCYCHVQIGLINSTEHKTDSMEATATWSNKDTVCNSLRTKTNHIYPIMLLLHLCVHACFTSQFFHSPQLQGFVV